MSLLIQSNFTSIISATVKLETKGLSLNDSIGIIESVHSSLNALRRKEFVRKLNAVLKRNPGYATLVQIRDVLSEGKNTNDDFVKSLDPKELALYKYCPTSTADVERSFSVYGNVLTQKRRSFLFENLKQHMIVLCNDLA